MLGGLKTKFIYFGLKLLTNTIGKLAEQKRFIGVLSQVLTDATMLVNVYFLIKIYLVLILFFFFVKQYDF